MSAVARLLLQKGATVSGSDLKENQETKKLQTLGAKITVPHHQDAIEPGMVVVVSTAIPKENVELQKARLLNLPVVHRSVVLTEIFKDKSCICVAGAHGKTSTSSLLSTILLFHDPNTSFSIGGIPKKLGVNSLYQRGKYAVIEADESDGSFLNTSPEAAIVTNTDPDHLYFWKTKENLFDAYRSFFGKVANERQLFFCDEDELLRKASQKACFYGFSQKADARVTNYRQEESFLTFDLNFDGTRYKELKVNLLGKHQLLNTAGAIALSLRFGVSEETIRKALETYHGVHRRLEFLGYVNDAPVFDDYAHHPKEVKETLFAIKSAFPKKRILCVFQPHRFSRLKDHFEDFQNAFESADHCLVTDVFSAGETSEGESLEIQLVDGMKCKNASYCKDFKNKLSQIVSKNDLIVFLGAGDITKSAREFARSFDGSQ